MPRQSARFAFIEQLLAEGVTHVFGNPGTTEQGFQDALQEYPQLQYILALQESVAVGAADGYARASGRPAFVQLHIMPGLGNAMGMLYNSYRMRTPLVIYAGQNPQRGNAQEPILSGDLVPRRTGDKWAVEAQDASEVPVLLRRRLRQRWSLPVAPFIRADNVMDESRTRTSSRRLGGHRVHAAPMPSSASPPSSQARAPSSSAVTAWPSAADRPN
jgi:benzoylformate decarboxylase